MNLDDYDHDIRPETSGTVFFAYALAWGINNGLLDKGTYYPAVKKAFLGLNANAIRPDGLVGRSELISAYPNPSCSLGIGSSQSYAPAATVMFLSELSKLVEQGYVTDDVEPALNKKMIGSIAVKEDSKYAVVNSRVRELVGGTELTTIKQDNKIYVPKDFVQEVYGEDIANEITDAIVNGGVSYVALDGVILEGSNRKLSSIANGISIISYKTELFNPTIDSKLIDLLNTGLTDGKYLERPDYEIRFNYTTPVEVPKPAADALISTEASTSGAVSASRSIGPNTESLVNVEFDMITTLTPSQTNAIVGLGSSDSNYGAYSQVPIIIRMYKDGCFGVYNGTGYYQSSIKFTQKEMYHLRVSVDLKAQKYSVFVTVPDQEETMIADNLAFRKTAQVPSEIGKIYLFNNDQEAGKYWIDNISLESKVTDVNKGALQELIDEVEELDENNYTAASWQTLQEALIAAKEVNDNVDAIQGEIDEACTILQAAKDNLVEKGTIAADKLALSIAVDLASNVTEEQLDKVVPAVVNEFNAALAEAKTILADDNAAQETVNASFARLSLAMHMLEFEKGDKTALQELIETANKLVEMDYTAASWQGLNEALQNAIDVNDDVNAMQEEVDDAYEALQEAMNNLVEAEEVNKTYLTTLVNYILGLDSDKYVTQTWEAMVPVLEKAQEVLANEEATQTEVDNIYLELINAFLQLRLKTEATDKTTLEVLIKEAETYQEKDFTNTSWQTLQETLKIAREVMDNETANQQEVDEACTMLQEAINNLVVRADKTLLEAMVNKISGLQENKYTESSWQAMIPVLEKAQEVLVNEEASQLEVDSALEGLTKVYLDLRLKPNKDLLNDLIKQVNGSNKASYSAKTWNAVEKALVKAVIVLNDPEASQAEVDDASYALAKAMAKLQEVNIVKTEAAVSVATGDNAAVYELFACSALLSLMYILKKVKF